MEHLYASRVKVQRLQLRVAEGRTAMHDWSDQEGTLANFPCRLDLLFLRPGKDVPAPFEAGVARDRMGVMFCSSDVPLLAGDRIVTLSGPIKGSFEIRSVPDQAQDYGAAHHIEVQVIETNQTLEGPTSYPDDALPEPLPWATPGFD